VAVSDFIWSYAGGWGLDIKYDIVLQQVRQPTVRTMDLDHVDELPLTKRTTLSNVIGTIVAPLLLWWHANTIEWQHGIVCTIRLL